MRRLQGRPSPRKALEELKKLGLSSRGLELGWIMGYVPECDAYCFGGF
jgi:hypothetical protein